jgi:hypothetical protein
VEPANALAKRRSGRNAAIGQPMDASRFDILARSLTDLSARRALVRGLAALGLQAAGVPSGAGAKRRKKPKRNAFGCLNVGQPCRGHGAKCCSGICQGKKPKKGDKDKSRCVAHDTGGCQAGQQGAFCGGANVPCTTSTGSPGVCDTTTGNAGYCAFTTTCSRCSKDADCRPVCGRGAACVKCATCIEDGGTRCVGLGPDACIFD